MPTDKKYQWLAHQVHVPTGEKPEKPGDPTPIKSVGPGLLSEMDLTDKQIKALPRGTIRAATADEIEAGEQRAATASIREAQARLQQEQQDAETERQNERRLVERKMEETKSEQLAKIEDAHAKEREKENKAAADELNKAAGVKAGGKK